MKPLGLYLHIPFCPYRCHYCDFLIFTGREEAIPFYVKTLVADIEHYASAYPQYQISTIFIGGGTPSLLEAEQIETVLSAVRKNFSVNQNAEVTLEANPETLTLEKLKGYREAAINRLSLGVQSLLPKHLSRSGRGHTPEEAYAGFETARQAGFQNINVDLMFGFPDQTLQEWMQTLEAVTRWNPDHLSMYSLQIEPGTPFGKDFKSGKLVIPPDEVQAEMYQQGASFITNQGFIHYEISNFAKPNFASPHNQIYWRNEEYLGLGLGAVSYIDTKRFWMTRNLSQYLSGRKRIAGSEVMTFKGQMGETVILGLRFIQGLSAKRFRDRFKLELHDVYDKPIRKFQNLGFLTWDGNYLRLTREGLPVSNEVLLAFV